MNVCCDQECILTGNKECGACPYDSDLDEASWQKAIKSMKPKGKKGEKHEVEKKV